jgi:hypothetical protein
MKYTKKLWTTNYLNYEWMLPRNEMAKDIVKGCLSPFIFVAIGIYLILFCMAIPYDGFRILRYSFIKNIEKPLKTKYAKIF